VEQKSIGQQLILFALYEASECASSFTLMMATAVFVKMLGNFQNSFQLNPEN
jgi:hypothetical protein